MQYISLQYIFLSKSIFFRMKQARGGAVLTVLTDYDRETSSMITYFRVT